MATLWIISCAKLFFFNKYQYYYKHYSRLNWSYLQCKFSTTLIFILYLLIYSYPLHLWKKDNNKVLLCQIKIEKMLQLTTNLILNLLRLTWNQKDKCYNKFKVVKVWFKSNGEDFVRMGCKRTFITKDDCETASSSR